MRRGPDRDLLTRSLLDLSLVAACVVVLGLVVGVVWPQLVDPAMSERTAQGIGTGEVELGKVFSADGWFAVLGFVGSALLGTLLMLRRRGHEVVVVLLLLAGSYTAARWIAEPLGTELGPPDPLSVLRDAEIGATAPVRVEVQSEAVRLVWPLGAASGALLVLLSVNRLERERRRSRSEEDSQIPAQAPSGD